MTDIATQPVTSSQIEAVGYDEAAQKMAVRFKGGAVYHYTKVEPKTFADLRDAKSVGSHFFKHIKPYAEKYPFKKQPEKTEAKNTV
jgi:hypothetical protein